MARFNNTVGASDGSLKTELAQALNVTNNGTFLPGSDLKLSDETDPSKAIEAFYIIGKNLTINKYIITAGTKLGR